MKDENSEGPDCWEMTSDEILESDARVLLLVEQSRSSGEGGSSFAHAAENRLVSCDKEMKVERLRGRVTTTGGNGGGGLKVRVGFALATDGSR